MSLCSNREPFRRANSHSEGFSIPWEKGCPLLVSLIDITRNPSTGEGFLDIRVGNISGEIIHGVIADVLVTYASGKQETFEYDCQDINLISSKTTSLGKIQLTDSEVDEITIDIAEVQTSVRKWESHGHASPVEFGETLDLTDEMMAARKILLKESGCTCAASALYAPIIGEDWWICSCGYPNSSTDDCVYCHLSKADAQSLCNPSAIVQHQKLLSNDHVNLINSLKDSVQKRNRRKRAVLAALAAASLCCAGLATYYFLSFAPSHAYDEAAKLAATGAEHRQNYADAYSEFIRLGDYRDSKQQAADAALNYIETWVLNGQSKDATYWVNSHLGEDNLDRNLITSVAEAKAQTCIDEGRYASAAAWFDFVGNGSKSQEARYQYVVSNIDGDFNNYVLTYLEDLASTGYADTEDLLKSYSEKWSKQTKEDK